MGQTQQRMGKHTCGISIALTWSWGATKSQASSEGACAWWEGGDALALGGWGWPGPRSGARGLQFSIFSAFQVSHEFAINFNPTNPFCSGECQAHLHLPWFLIPG